MSGNLIIKLIILYLICADKNTSLIKGVYIQQAHAFSVFPAAPWQGF